MSPAQSNGQQAGDKAAAGWFAAVMTLALGGAGLVIAALAVGAERAWNGGAVEGSRQRERGMGWLDTQRAWLEQDHRARTGRARAYRDWLNSGSDPESQPTRPSWWRRLVDGFRRQMAHVAVGGQDFTRGARAGWRAANKVRRDGGGFKDIAGARPGDDQPTDPTGDDSPAPEQTCRNCRRAGVPVDFNGSCVDCNRPTPGPYDTAEPNGLGSAPGDAPEGVNSPPIIVPRFRPDTPDDFPSTTEQPPPSTGNTVIEGEPMTAPTQPGAQAATESNATVLRAKLQSTQGTLGRLADLTDQLAAMRQQLDQQVRDADEFAQATGQSAQARTALDESSALAAAMGERLGEFSQGAVGAQEQVMQASDGLRVAENAEDELRSAGADGRAVAPAGANA